MNEMDNKIFDDINGYSLDKEQRAAILTPSQYCIIVAGAGSGKTLTMIGKIKYLTLIKKIEPAQILCISFTNETTKSLQEKLGALKVDVLTFHKLAIKILKLNNLEYELVLDDYLDDIIKTFFTDYCYQNPLFFRNFQKLYHKPFLTQKKYTAIINSLEFKKVHNLIKQFINLYNAHNLKAADFIKLFTKKDSPLLILTYAIINFYEQEKRENNLLDFNDLIKKAIDLMHDNAKFPHYAEIIVDEFQDTSLLRLNLIQELVFRNQAKLTVVGDDFQSIYKFSGCDINLFLNFSDYFPQAATYKIQNTYRNSQELINIAGDFVMKNQNQITKKLTSHKHLPKPIKLIKEKDKKTTLIKTILYIQKNLGPEILILGRNNKDIYNYLSPSEIKWQENNYFTYQNWTLRYLTVHKSKGLESENVIIINLENSQLGFPSQIPEPHIIKNIKKEENFLFAEERRLFYVALTRTKNYCFLLIPKNPSIFIKEIKKDKKHTETLKL